MTDTLPNKDISKAMSNIYEEYPVVIGWGIKVIDERGTPLGLEAMERGGKAEYFRQDETGHPSRPNPHLGTPTIEIYDPSVSGKSLENLIFGDMLHHAKVDPEFDELRNKFKKSITRTQHMIDKNAYKRDQQERGEDRPYEQWHDVSRLDAYIRGAISPDAQDAWAGSYTPQQEELINAMKTLLGRPVGQN